MVYYSQSNISKLYVGAYVDDSLIVGNTRGRISEFKDTMNALFDITDLGLLKSYLGIHVKQIKGEITLAQSTFALKILYDFNLH